MKSPLNIICHAFPSWKGDYVKSTVELMRSLSHRHRVLYVDYQYTLLDLMRGILRDRSIPVLRILGLKPSLRKVSTGENASLYLLSLPPVLPLNWIQQPVLHDAFQKMNGRIIARRLKRTIKTLQMRDAFVINAFNPIAGIQTNGLFAGNKRIYYCYDNIGATNWAAKHGSRLEKEFVGTVDAVVFSSNELRRNKAAHSDSFVVNNGVDLSIFNSPRIETDKDSKTVVIGYVGSIDDRLDFDMLSAMAHTYKDWQFVFVGPVRTQASNVLANLSNVRFLGSQPADLIPDLMVDWDAGIIPFVRNEFTMNCYPMKANEYLAMGLPVVMTDFAYFDDLSTVARVATREQFADAVADELGQDSKTNRMKRVQFAHSNSWENRSREFENILYRYA